MIVTKIIDAAAKRGVGAKGEWVQALVELDNGKQKRIFQPIAINDEVEEFQNGDYINYRKTGGKGKATAEGYAHILKGLTEIYKQNRTILEGIDMLNARFTDLAEKIDSNSSPDTKLSDVMDETLENPYDHETDPENDPMEEEVNVSDIPF
jgi:hypothetical protein